MAQSLPSLITSYLEHLEIEKGRSPLTIRDYDQYLRAFLSWCEEHSPISKPSEITVDLVRKFRIHLSRQKNNRGDYFAPSTQNYYVIALRNFLKFLAKQDVKTLSPDKLELRKQTRPQVSVLDLTRYEVMLRAARPDGPDDLAGLRDFAMLHTLFSTGLRVGELVRVNRDQINLKTREFTIRGKGNKDRVVFLSHDAAAVITGYLKKRKDAYVPLFLNHRGSAEPHDKRGETLRLTARSVQRIIATAAKRAGIVERITPHTLRHTFATDLLRNGADLRSVQEMLGHSSIQTTQIYTHVTNRQLKEVHEAFHSRKFSRKNNYKG